MSAKDFSLAGDLIDPIEDGETILLTGDDMDALESVFFALLQPEGEEVPLVVSTTHRPGAISREFDDATIITAAGSSYGDDVTVVEDHADLTTLGMELSARFGELADVPVRAGIFHTTDLTGEADDTRSVYRFLNSNLLTHIRRQSAMGVAALHTGADSSTSIDSMVRGMETSFTGRINIESADHDSATVSVSGFGSDGEFDISL
jgi:hypothetical protein